MTRSMTGFAGANTQQPFGRLAWEIRSLNHRYLEVSLRLPEEFRPLEPAVRDILGRYVSRGKIDATLRFEPDSGDAGARFELNTTAAERLLELHGRLAARAGEDQPPNITALLRWPGVVFEQAPDPEPMHAAALQILEEAAAGLQRARAREGEKLAAAIRERLQGISHWTGEIRQWLPDIRAALRDKLLNRIADLPETLDPGRLEQEVALLAQKIDVDEELDRLEAHVAEAGRVLDLDEPIGRRLDFLMQEFNRESNTLSSKSVDQRTTQAAVELKVLVEQMREQVQNIE